MCADLLRFLVRCWGLDFEGASTVSMGLSWALTYLAHRQAGLYLASPLPCCPKESRFTLTILGPPGSFQGRPKKQSRGSHCQPGHRSKAKGNRRSILFPPHQVASLLRITHLPAPLLPKRVTWRSRSHRGRAERRGAPCCLPCQPASPSRPLSPAFCALLGSPPAS